MNTRRKLRWNRYDATLAGVTLAAIVVICGLAVAPSWLRITAIAVAYLAFLAGLVVAFHRPMDAVDRYCSEVDEDLDRRRQRDAQERSAADLLRSQRNVVALPQRPSAEVVPFPTDRGAA